MRENVWEEKSEIADDEIQTLPLVIWYSYILDEIRSVTKFKSNFFDGIRKALVKRNTVVLISSLYFAFSYSLTLVMN